MIRISRRRFPLSLETIRVLASSHLRDAAGGQLTEVTLETIECTAQCSHPCSSPCFDIRTLTVKCK